MDAPGGTADDRIIHPGCRLPCPRPAKKYAMATSVYMTWANEAPHTGALRLVRHCLRPGTTITRHRHEFAEVFWCEAGTGYHRCGDQDLPLQPGDTLCINPDDIHALGAGPDGLTFVNASFLPQAVRDLATRHQAHWPWRPGQAPCPRRLTLRARERLDEWVSDLALAEIDELTRDAFLLDLMRLLNSANDGPDAPRWLREALAVFCDPLHLGGGTARLASLCNRSSDQLNRQVRRCLGITATELVNRLRLDSAARMLVYSRQSVAEIAASCGLPHAGHFHQLFRQRYGVTPLRYRRAAWSSAARKQPR